MSLLLNTQATQNSLKRLVTQRSEWSNVYYYYFRSQPGQQDQSLKWSIDAICNHGKPSSCVNRKFIICIIWLEGQDAIASKNGVYVPYLWERYYD